MKFIDEAVIRVQAGHGGRGARSFHREKFVPMGGPDGGNGGRGGNVILKASRHKSSLLDFQYKPRWKAQDGKPGQGSNRDGKAGQDLLVEVPIGTQVYKLNEQAQAASDQFETQPELAADLLEESQEFVLASGGRGGKGNAFFKSPTNQAPEHFQPGEPGQQGVFRLSLKLVADVALVGFPNAGKSTLISRISAARPKIADYPFTTLTPNLGVVRGGPRGSFVVADVPGLVAGAHQGKGLGTRFLKHIERCRVIAHLIDPLMLDENGHSIDPMQAFSQIENELRSYSEELASRPRVVVITKIDALPDRQRLGEIEAGFTARGLTCLSISSASGEGLQDLVGRLAELAAR